MLALLAVSCGGEERETAATASTGGDGGVDAGLDIPPPAPPQMKSWTCAQGWLPETMLEGTELEYSICVPPPLPESCPEGMMPVLGETACQPIGDPCPVGEWPEGLPASAVVYVAAGATGGDGSSTSAPLGSIGDAVAAAPSGAVVAIAKGTYPEAITVGKAITLWGACVTGVTIDGPTGGVLDATIAVLGAGSGTIRNLTVTGSRLGMMVDGGGTLHGEGVRVVAATGAGVLALGGTLDLDGVAVTDTQAFSDDSFGVGLETDSGAHATVRRALFDRNRYAGVLALGIGMELALEDVVVRSTQSQASDQRFGRGLVVASDAHATVTRVLIDRNRYAGLLAHGAGADLVNVVVRDTEPQESDQEGGLGLGVGEGARATVEQALFERNRGIGVGAGGDTEVTLTDVVVRDTQSQGSDEQFGEGLNVGFGARATVERALFDRNREAGVAADGTGTDLALTDVVVKDTQAAESDQQFGRGLNVVSGAHATVERALLEHNRDVGVLASLTGTITLTDVVVKDTRARDDNGEFGVGVVAASGATIQVVSSRISGSRVAGALAMSGGQLMVSVSEIVATQGGSFTLLGPDGMMLDGPHYDAIGDGVLVVGGSSATLTDVRVAECARAGILFSDSSGSLASVASTANRYGFALQGSPQPSHDVATCDFSGNTELPILTDGNLPVPNAPLDVPQAP